jgi:hypothetical protein
MPPKERLIGDVGLILMPKFPATEREALASILAYYPELLVKDYTWVAASRNWILYRRAKLGTGSAGGNSFHQQQDPRVSGPSTRKRPPSRPAEAARVP